MAYRRPFTPKQRSEAARAYRSYRAHLAYLRRWYPPTTDAERRVLKDYADAVRELAQELRKLDRFIDVALLTRTDAWAKWLAVEYRRLRALES